jgi:hypothetical protein
MANGGRNRHGLRSALLKAHLAFRLLGFDAVVLLRALAGIPAFLRDAWRYRQRSESGGLPLRLANIRPCLADRFENAGVASGHYFHQDLWAAQKIFRARPSRHVDIGSRLDGFVAHVLTFMPVEVIDVRPLESGVEGLSFVQEDATTLTRYADDSIESLSSLHAVEHFGLGRYGDPVDPIACFEAMRAFARVLRPSGRLYFSVPVGRERVEFNSQRVFSPASVLRELASLRLVSFSAVDDSGALHLDCDPAEYETARYACGLFEFTK